MKELKEIVPFKTSIFYTTLDDYTYLIPKIKELQRTTPSETISNRGGWQSKAYDSNELEFMIPLIKDIREYVLSVYSFLSIKGNAESSGYWFNVNKEFDYNISHRHAECYYCAVFYFKVPSNSGKLIFERPDDMHDFMRFNEMHDENWGSYFIDPKPNMLVLFPPYLKHYVEPNRTTDLDSDRISLAINFR